MSDITEGKPHRIYGTGYGIAFYKDGTASNRESANKAVLYIGAPGMPYPEFWFKLPDEQHEMTRLERALQKVFQAGDNAARLDIRRCLGVKEPR